MLRRVKKFVGDRDANVAMIFGLVAVPLAGAIGALVDYSRAANNRTKVQAVIDSTALNLAKRAVTLSQAQMQTEGEAMVRNQLAPRRELSVQSVVVNKGTTAVSIQVTGSVPANFVRMWGQPSISIGASTQVTWGTRKIEVALVLDNTGSMGSNGKMNALKTAATNFVNTMQAASVNAESVKLSLVPFDTGVKVGTEHSNASWLTKYYMPAWQQPNWDGCVMDRNQNYDVDDTPPSGALATLYPARMCPNASLAKIMPMTNDFNALRTRISQMTPAGNTNLTVGIAWGLATLSPGNPMSGAENFGTPRLEKFMILLTDGLNTQNRWTSSTSAIDARTALACAAVKAQNVKLYTVRVIDGNASLLRACATNTDMFYDVQNAAQLDPVFQAIANSINAIRITS